MVDSSMNKGKICEFGASSFIILHRKNIRIHDENILLYNNCNYLKLLADSICIFRESSYSHPRNLGARHFLYFCLALI